MTVFMSTVWSDLHLCYLSGCTPQFTSWTLNPVFHYQLQVVTTCSNTCQPRHKNRNTETKTTIPEIAQKCIFQFHEAALLLQQGDLKHSLMPPSGGLYRDIANVAPEQIQETRKSTARIAKVLKRVSYYCVIWTLNCAHPPQRHRAHLAVLSTETPSSELSNKRNAYRIYFQ